MEADKGVVDLDSKNHDRIHWKVRRFFLFFSITRLYVNLSSKFNLNWKVRRFFLFFSITRLYVNLSSKFNLINKFLLKTVNCITISSIISTALRSFRKLFMA